MQRTTSAKLTLGISCAVAMAVGALATPRAGTLDIYWIDVEGGRSETGVSYDREPRADAAREPRRLTRDRRPADFVRDAGARIQPRPSPRPPLRPRV